MLAIQKFKERYGLIPAAVDASHLRAIGAAFAHLPYENVTKILKEARAAGSLNKLRMPDEVLDDHLRWNTGGTCFSLCNTLLSLLENCGYTARIGMADMRYGANIHCAVIVSLPGSDYLLDPGYLLNVPVPLPEAGKESSVQTPMNRVIVRREEDRLFSLYTWEGGEEKWRYRLRSTPVSHQEFVDHWIHSFSLNTMEQVMLSRLQESGRLYFRKDRLELVNTTRRHKTRVGAASELSEAFGLPASMIQQAQQYILSRPS